MCQRVLSDTPLCVKINFKEWENILLLLFCQKCCWATLVMFLTAVEQKETCKQIRNNNENQTNT